MTTPPPVDVWKLADLCTPWCIHVVVTLRVPDLLAAGTSELHELATAAGADPAALARVLRHLVGERVLAEPRPGSFALTEAAQALVGPGPRLGLDLDGFGGRMAHAWSSLLPAVRTGSSAYATVFGRGFWDDLAAHPELSATFDALMGPEGHGPPDPDVLLADDWQGVRTVVDVGGGTGPLLAAILRAHPGVRGVLGVTPDEDGPPPPDLLMLVLVGGKARTLSELRALAEPVGLRVRAAGRRPSGRHLVELEAEVTP